MIHTCSGDPCESWNWSRQKSFGIPRINRFRFHQSVSQPWEKSSWKTYLKYPRFLDSLGRENSINWMFVIKMYSQSSTAKSINSLRVELLHRTNDPEKLPPTNDCLIQHILGSNYQVMVWINASVPNPFLPTLEESGWHCQTDGSLEPTLMTLTPVPSACTELLSCACKTKCVSQHCTCRKLNIKCSRACYCGQDCFNARQQEKEVVD